MQVRCPQCHTPIDLASDGQLSDKAVQMALDVHIVDDPRRQGLTGELPACQFEEAIHSYIFHGAGVDIYNRYAYLRRMIDFYAR